MAVRDDFAAGEVLAAVDLNDTFADKLTLADAALKANLASPTFTGTPAAPTAAVGTSTTQLATTAFVNRTPTGFTPTLNNMTLGNGSLQTFFRFFGASPDAGVVVYSGGIDFGSTTTVSGTIQVTLPIFPVFDRSQGVAMFDDASAGIIYTGIAVSIFTNPVSLQFRVGSTLVNATSPMTWAVSDSLRFTITYLGIAGVAGYAF
jgi:hypothetical protein